MARQSRPLEYDYDGIDESVCFVVVLLTSIAVEIARYYLHPEMYRVLAHPYWLASCSIAFNIAYHLWSHQATFAKAAVSAVFGQASMPTLLTILVTMFWGIVDAVLTAVGQFTAPPVPH